MWLGIDFSGDSAQWGAGRKTSNVWVAELGESRVSLDLELQSLRRVQELSGDSQPFARLARLLGAGGFRAAAIDAPFSIPAARLMGQTHADLLGRVVGIEDQRRPFPRGSSLVALVAPGTGPRGVKEYRRTEKVWIDRGLNLRSTLWVKPRGGAPMTAAALALLKRTGGAIWPWTPQAEGGLLVEAFPAAQLKTWTLPFQGYNGKEPAAQDVRDTIVRGISNRVRIPPRYLPIASGCADALDALLCAFAAVAVARSALAVSPEPAAAAEGWIAVHR